MAGEGEDVGGGSPTSEQKTKTTNLVKDSSKSDLSSMRRLVEYFVVVSSVASTEDGTGVSESKSFEEQTQPTTTTMTTTTTQPNSKTSMEEEFYVEDINFQPKITARYPIHDHSSNPLHENVTFFCHPSGNIQMRTEQSMPKIHFFAATGGTGKQMYGTCMTIWEPMQITAKIAKSTETKQLQVYLPKCLVLLSAYQYLMAFREFLTQLGRLMKMGDMVLPLERYIVNFCAEIPAPAPGAFEVQTTILDSIIKIWAPPHNQPIAWVALPFGHLFECLDVDNIVTVWHCLTLERQVLLTSTQLSLLTTCAEIFLSLLYPMRWSHAYIPVLPHFMVPILSAPMPFFCGINKSNLASALCDLSGDCVVVDLDMNLVTLGPNTPPLPALPPQMENTLRARLDENVGMVFREARSLTKQDDYSERGLHLPPHVKLMADAMWEGKLCLFDEAFHLMFTPEESKKNLLNGNDASGLDASERGNADLRTILQQQQQERSSMRDQSKWDAVQEAFMDSFVYLLRNYRKFLVFPSKSNEGSYGGAGFRSKEFVEGQRYDMQEFLQEFIGTQMFDSFVTKRLYGSGEADVAFFDLAVDRFLKHAGILSNVDLGSRFLGRSSIAATNRRSSAAVVPSSSAGSSRNLLRSNAHSNREPLLQSARVHRKLKTIVPPEPSGEGLPPIPTSAHPQGVDLSQQDDNASVDDASVGSISTQSTHSTRASASAGTSPRKMHRKKSVQEKAAEILEKSQYRYTYPTFPSTLDESLFGEPRPLPSAVIAEFDRQKKDAARFRRRGTGSNTGSSLSSSSSNEKIRRKEPNADDTPPSPEVATFTLFFMSFSAVVGKELMDISKNPLLAQDKTILATYTVGDDVSVTSSVPDTVVTEDEEEEDEEEKAGVAHMKSTRPDIGGLLSEDDDDDDEVHENGVNNHDDAGSVGEVSAMTPDPKDDLSTKHMAPTAPPPSVPPPVPPPEPKTINGNGNSGTQQPPQQARSRFTTSLSKAQIEEAQTTGRAQLALAFEMLGMMKKRGLKADPEAYQCLIDACGRVGDTKRATQLLSRMHEDGIVADGVVYSCLVSAFSAESAWKQVSGDGPDEDLPEWANSTSIEMDWNKLQQQSFLDRAKKELRLLAGGSADDDDEPDEISTMQRLRNYVVNRNRKPAQQEKSIETISFYVSEPVEMQIELGENLLEVVYSDISVDTDNETCPRCNYLLSDDDVVSGWTPSDSQDYTTACPNCTQRFVPHFCVQSTSPSFMGSKGPESPLMCERLSPWVLQKEIRTVMADREGIENILSPEWRERQTKNAVLWWNLVLSCMRYRFPFSFLLQGSFEQNLIAPMPGQDE